MIFPSLTLHSIIFIMTILLSLNAMNKEDVKEKMMFIPYLCKTDGQN